MQFKKVFSDKMERCYSVACMAIDGEPHAFFATEGKNGGCVAVSCTDFGSTRQVLAGPGGTMSLVEIPGKDNEFLTGVKFYSLADWEEAAVAWASRGDDGAYQLNELFAAPYLHRFDILTRNGVRWFIGCVLAAHKATKEDFSESGCVYVARMPDAAGVKLDPQILCTGFFRNHGYERVVWKDCEAGMVSCDSGVYVLTPPQNSAGSWSVEQVMEQATSDIAMIDIDGDGESEIATIERFHGKHFRIYKNMGGQYKKVYEHPEQSDFYHVASSGKVGGKPVFIGGCRRGRQQLFLVSWDEAGGQFEVSTVEENVGPSNAMIAHVAGKDLLISANRESSEAAVYEIC